MRAEKVEGGITVKLRFVITGLVVLVSIFSAQADLILWDINELSGTANDGTLADFSALGITEDLTGATVTQVNASTNGVMSGGGITLSYTNGFAHSITSYTNVNNNVLRDYVYLQDGGAAGPVTMQISGLNALLSANTTYSFYLIGSGERNEFEQGAEFTFNSVTLTTTSQGTLSDSVAKFSFTTGSVVGDTLEFNWDRVGSNTWSGFNGFAIAAVPEPATIGLFTIFGLGLFASRRSFLKKQDEK
jgi:hypothetical protein